MERGEHRVRGQVGAWLWWLQGLYDALSSPEARLLYRLPGPIPDGQTVLLLSPLELLQRLARLVPPPRMHRHRYHGVLAPNARLRAQVVAIGRSASDDVSVTPTVTPVGAEDEAVESNPSHVPEPSPSSRSSARIRWAQLLARIYQVLPLLCPSCGGDMRILAFLTDPPVVQGILLYLDLPHRPPRSPRPGARLKVTSSWIRLSSSISPSPT